MPSITYLNTNAPLPEQAATWLLDRAVRIGDAADLSRILVLVPTLTSGRKLREWLTWQAKERELGGVLPPRILTPPQFVELGIETHPVASDFERRVAWIRVLASIDSSSLNALFPIEPRQPNDLTWQCAIADALMETRRILGEAGLLFSDVAARDDIPERRRWADLAALERRFLDILRKRGLEDRETIRKHLAASASLSQEYDAVFVVGVPDALPLAIQRMEKEAAAGMPVEILVYCEEKTGPAAFDAWGRPGSAWTTSAIPFEDFSSQVHLTNEARQQVKAVTDLLTQSTAALTAVGLLDPSLERLLTNQLTAEGHTVYNPGGQLLRDSSLLTLLHSLIDAVTDNSVLSAGRLLRCPGIIGAMEAAWKSEQPFDVARLLDQWDRIAAAHLPSSFQGFVQLLDHDEEWWQIQGTLRSRRAPSAEIKYALKFLSGLIALFDRKATGASLAELLESILERVYGRQAFDQSSSDTRLFAAALAAVRETVASIADDQDGLASLPARQILEFALQQVAEQHHFPSRPDTDPEPVELQGWLESLWEEKPHIVLAGFNEGIVPQSVTSHAFLPESQREMLGLTNNEQRCQRDAYLLSTLLSAHGTANGGRLDVVLGRQSATKDPLRPSRLLLLCSDENLPSRVKQLFPSEEQHGRQSAPVPPWTAPWQLHLSEETKSFSGLAVTAFRDYLACPYRFFLKRRLSMDTFDPAKVEMDALDFGNLVHTALETMGNDESMRDCTNSDELRDFLRSAFDDAVRGRYGGGLSVPLLLQAESARSRLDSAAHVQAGERANGWRIHNVEQRLHEHFELPAIEIGGLSLRGIIDRVEQHERTEEWRVLDYKTNSSADAPEKKHWRKLYGARPEHLHDYAFFDHDGHTCYWTDLQLPLYGMAIREWYAVIPQCGYFNLPKKKGDTGIKSLPLDHDILEAARTCAEGVANDIIAERFGPPAEKVPYDIFERLLFDRPSETVAQ